MIKVKLLNSHIGRNNAVFHPFHIPLMKFLYEYGIEILLPGRDDLPSDLKKRSETSDYDYIFIGPQDFVDKKKSLKDSVEWGLENINKLSEGGDYFLFDGFDSTSLLGTYDVFEQSNAIYMFKNQLLKNREDYNKPYIGGKWFFGTDDNLGNSYDIPEDKWNRIKLSGINLINIYMSRMNLWRKNGNKKDLFGNHNSRFFKLISPENKVSDISAIYLTEIGKGYEHGIRNDLLYTKHRKDSWKILSKLNYNIITSDHMGKHLTPDSDEYSKKYYEYISCLSKSRVSISPFGQGEICYRDMELMQLGTLMIKPDMSMINTNPNIYINDETYIPCKYDWSDLEEKVDYVLSNYNEINERIIYAMRAKLNENFHTDMFCNHWYEIFKNLPGVKQVK